MDETKTKVIFDFFGQSTEIEKAHEELSELNTILYHWKDKRASREDVAKEIADVKIIINHLERVFGQDIIRKHVQEKLDRTLDRINSGYYQKKE